MQSLLMEVAGSQTPEQIVASLSGEGVVLLRTGLFNSPSQRYSIIAADPFLIFRSTGSQCLLQTESKNFTQFGNPWQMLDHLICRYEILDEIDLPFPLGGCFGWWGFELKNFVEPKLSQRAVQDLEIPDCAVGFYDSLVVIDHHLSKTWIISTGMQADGTRSEQRAGQQMSRWERRLKKVFNRRPNMEIAVASISSTFSRESFIEGVKRIKKYIYQGDIYQVNLAQRLQFKLDCPPFALFEALSNASPAPHAAYLDFGQVKVVSSSPEQFLKMSGNHIQTRPIKGTRPRGADPLRDAQLSYELQSSPKELAELVMITDLLRNDLGKICEYGSVHVPELVKLEKYPQVQHLVSTVEGEIRSSFTHLGALASTFPGGSISGAPKIRALEIIDELEPVSRGVYTGSIGYIGFNRESQLNIAIRTATVINGDCYFHVGAGIVADSDPVCEYDETLAKAAGLFAALKVGKNCVPTFSLPKGVGS